MWKIKIVYNDGSELTLTGKHKDIPLRLAKKYYMMYVAGRSRRSVVYQRYPKKDHLPVSLEGKIEELQKAEFSGGVER